MNDELRTEIESVTRQFARFDKGFTAREFAEVQGISLDRAYKVMKQWKDKGWLENSGHRSTETLSGNTWNGTPVYRIVKPKKVKQ